ncbi:MAG: aminotransferase class V-fold PLP-dependent enzyme [Saprospiraceae bacterium]
MLDCQKDLFNLDNKVTYLNCAYMSPQLKSVAQVGKQQIGKKDQPWTISIPDFYEPVKALKAAFAKLIHAEHSNRIALIPSASYGIATVTQNIDLQEGQKVLMPAEQFPSNYYSWERLCQKKGGQIHFVKAPDNLNRSEDWSARIIEAIDGQTAVVALGHVHWADGSLFDLKAIRKACDRVGAYLIIDGTQSVGALPFNVQEIKPDALICGGYKWLLGPYSLGLAYYGPRFDDGIPLEENWISRHNSEDFAGLVNYEPRYQAGAARYSVGEHSNFFLVPQLLEAITQLNAWQPENIQEYCKHIATDAIHTLLDMDMQIDQSAQKAHHLFGVRLPKGLDLKRLKSSFSENNVFVSQRGNAIRVAPHVYNTKTDLKYLVGCFTEALVNY